MEKLPLSRKFSETPREPKKREFRSYGAVVGTHGIAGVDFLLEQLEKVSDDSFRNALLDGFAVAAAEVELQMETVEYMSPLSEQELSVLQRKGVAIAEYVLAVKDGRKQEVEEEYKTSTEQRRREIRALTSG